MAKLTSKKRNSLSNSSFAIPGERKYPIPDTSHADNALARVSQFGDPEEKAKVRSAVKKKFPKIRQKTKAESYREVRDAMGGRIPE